MSFSVRPYDFRTHLSQVSKAPTVDVPCSASEKKSKLKGTLKIVQDKMSQETSVHKLKKLLRERRHACELMETISALDEEGNSRLQWSIVRRFP